MTFALTGFPVFISKIIAEQDEEAAKLAVFTSDFCDFSLFWTRLFWLFAAFWTPNCIDDG